MHDTIRVKLFGHPIYLRLLRRNELSIFRRPVFDIKRTSPIGPRKNIFFPYLNSTLFYYAKNSVANDCKQFENPLCGGRILFIAPEFNTVHAYKNIR